MAIEQELTQHLAGRGWHLGQMPLRSLQLPSRARRLQVKLPPLLTAYQLQLPRRLPVLAAKGSHVAHSSMRMPPPCRSAALTAQQLPRRMQQRQAAVLQRAAASEGAMPRGGRAPPGGRTPAQLRQCARPSPRTNLPAPAPRTRAPPARMLAGIRQTPARMRRPRLAPLPRLRWSARIWIPWAPSQHQSGLVLLPSLCFWTPSPAPAPPQHKRSSLCHSAPACRLLPSPSSQPRFCSSAGAPASRRPRPAEL